MTTTRTPGASPAVTDKAAPLTFDERLALAVLAIDARIDTKPLDLADVIRIPEPTPLPLAPTAAPGPYNTPIAATLWRARLRIETDGWSTEAAIDEQGARCPIGAIRVEAADRRTADDACILLLDVIQQHFVDAETIPSWNDAQTSPAPVLLQLGRAAELADSRGI